MSSTSGAVPRSLQLFVLLGALLLFGLEPLVGKLLLPAWGGAFNVWATCLMFFQGGLFLGYLYCHWGARRLGRYHLAVLALPLLFLPFWARHGFVSQPDAQRPLLSLLLALSAWIGVPFVVLSSTGVVAQSWLAEAPGRPDPYPLYAASNLGSLGALLGYPFLIEPFLPLSWQRWGLLIGYLGYLALAVAIAPEAGRGAASPETEPAPAEPTPTAEPTAEAGDAEPPGPAPTSRPSWRLAGYWFLLAMAPSALLVAVTNAIALDVGSAPLVWVVPLALYLGTFVLCFRSRPWQPYLLCRFWPELGLFASYFIWFRSTQVAWQAPLHLLVLFSACLAGHGELYRSRPAPRYLTHFYLAVALGGWAGGAFVSVLAPALFDRLYEYPLALLALFLTIAVGRWPGLGTWAKREPWHALLLSLGTVVLTALAATYVTWFGRPAEAVARWRNVYGIYRVIDRPAEPGQEPLRLLLHGTTRHGVQVLEGPFRQRPVGYYHPRSPLGDLLLGQLQRPQRRIAVVGLGAGATAAFLGPSDSITFYELDPDLEGLARTHFSYLSDAERRGVRVRVVPGDARLQLAQDPQAPPAGYDLIVIDAFTSDAIPTHLLTREALEAYLVRLAPQGTLLFHISSRHYELAPVLKATSTGLGAGAYKFRDAPAPGQPGHDYEDDSEYYAVRRSGQPLDDLLQRGWTAEARIEAAPTPWRDDFANVLWPLWQRSSAHLALWWRGLGR